MRILMLAALVLAALAASISELAFGEIAFAAPKVGDTATFDATVTVGAATTKATAVLELLKQDGEKFLQRTTVTYEGAQPSVTEEWKESSELLDDARVDEVLAACAAQGGKPGKITVPAGTFEACELGYDDDGSAGTDWIAKVPFGTAKSEYTLKADGKRVELSLRSFH